MSLCALDIFKTSVGPSRLVDRQHAKVPFTLFERLLAVNPFGGKTLMQEKISDLTGVLRRGG